MVTLVSIKYASSGAKAQLIEPFYRAHAAFCVPDFDEVDQRRGRGVGSWRRVRGSVFPHSTKLPCIKILSP